MPQPRCRNPPSGVPQAGADTSRAPPAHSFPYLWKYHLALSITITVTLCQKSGPSTTSDLQGENNFDSATYTLPASTRCYGHFSALTSLPTFPAPIHRRASVIGHPLRRHARMTTPIYKYTIEKTLLHVVRLQPWSQAQVQIHYPGWIYILKTQQWNIESIKTVQLPPRPENPNTVKGVTWKDVARSRQFYVKNNISIDGGGETNTSLWFGGTSLQPEAPLGVLGISYLKWRQ